MARRPVANSTHSSFESRGIMTNTYITIMCNWNPIYSLNDAITQFEAAYILFGAVIYGGESGI